jgi:hypothetical protein
MGTAVDTSSNERGGPKAAWDRRLVNFLRAQWLVKRRAIAGNSQSEVRTSDISPEVSRLLFRLWINQHARVQNRVRVERSFRGDECARKTLGPLTIVPTPMIAADRMMMGNSAAEPDQFV